MSTSGIHYFAYGSNMSTARLAARVREIRALGVGRLHDHELVFDKPGRDGTAKANVRPAGGRLVHGVVWEIGSDSLSALDRFEPGYIRHELEIVVTGLPRLSAWTYVYAGEASDAAASIEYVRHLLDGAREHGLPVEVLAGLEAHTTPGT